MTRDRGRGRYRPDPVDVARDALAAGAFRFGEVEYQDRIVLPILRRAGWRLHVIRDSRAQHWGAASGWPDVVAVRGDRLVALELKLPGEEPTEEQRAWLQALAAVRRVDVAVLRVTPSTRDLESLIA